MGETVAGGQTAWNLDPNGNGTNAYVATFASTAVQLVDRYKDDVKQWEVWNEPNAWSNPNFQTDPTHAGGTYILPRVYALGSVGGNSYLYADNFATGNVDVLKGSSGTPDLTGRFTDPNLPAGYAPFNVQNLGGAIYVAYAVPDAAHHDEIAGAGLGVVALVALIVVQHLPQQ